MPKFNKVMIANRGEIACRILKTLDRMDIPGAVVFHPVDADAPAVKMAAESVHIDGPTPVAAYLDVENIIRACKKTGADAVHPGFGFLAENADFARRLTAEGITFIGPMPETIELMGNKIAARSFCIENGFPILPSATGTDGKHHFFKRVKEIGVPVLIKAAAGGGGKGMHIVRDMDQLDRTLKLAGDEAYRSFGNSDIYAERYVEASRHIEVQIIADHHGRVIHLGERECSLQRRFQKIIEESPAPGLDPGLRRTICLTAVEIARKAGYHNAGTVEFILDADGRFTFLEMNTRLQVEHPVTEMVTGLDLVELQIRIAGDEKLPLSQDQVSPEGHAVELRLYAEDPENDFLPATGTLLEYRLPEGHDIRTDNGFAKGMAVSSAFDPMLAKLTAHGETRGQAIETARNALEETLVFGVTTNIDFLARILSHPAFTAGLTDTGFIPRYAGDLNAPPLTEGQCRLLLAAAALGSRAFADPAFEVPEPHASIGNWRN